MESAWSNGKPAYRCRHGHTSASAPDPERQKTAYVREDRVLPHLPALHLPALHLHLLLTGPSPENREGGSVPAAAATSGTGPPRT
ncbi:MAG: hypothetical protein M3Z75_09535 [Actinomycetota bacterium]|nr:hypothetical protein [Actinomycetota bacterium]